MGMDFSEVEAQEKAAEILIRNGLDTSNEQGMMQAVNMLSEMGAEMSDIVSIMGTVEAMEQQNMADAQFSNPDGGRANFDNGGLSLDDDGNVVEAPEEDIDLAGFEHAGGDDPFAEMDAGIEACGIQDGGSCTINTTVENGVQETTISAFKSP